MRPPFTGSLRSKRDIDALRVLIIRETSDIGIILNEALPGWAFRFTGELLELGTDAYAELTDDCEVLDGKLFGFTPSMN